MSDLKSDVFDTDSLKSMDWLQINSHNISSAYLLTWLKSPGSELMIMWMIYRVSLPDKRV